MARRASYREGLSFGALSFLAMATLGLVSSVVIARLYGIEVLGQFALAAAATGILTQLSTLQEQRAMVRELAVLPPRVPRVTGLFAAVFAFSISLRFVVGLLVAFVTYLLLVGPVDQPGLVVPAWVMIAEYVVLTNTSWNLDMVFASFRAGRQLFVVRVTQAIAFLAFAVAGGIVTDSVWGLVVAQVASAGLGLLLRIALVHAFMAFRVPGSEIRRGFKSLPEVIRFGARLAPGGIADGLSRESGTWILGLVSSVVAVGAWSRAWMLTLRLLDASNRVTEMLFPTLMERRAAKDMHGFDRAAIDSARYVGTGMLWPAAVGGGAAYGVMEIFGPGFAQAADALAILLAFPAFYAVASILGQVLLAHDRPGLNSIFNITRLIVTVAVATVLTILMGVTGTAIGFLVGIGLEVLARIVLIRPHLTSALHQLAPARTLIAVALAYPAGFMAARVLETGIGGVPGLLLALVAGTLAYWAVLVLARGYIPRDRERLAPVVARVRRRAAATPPVVPVPEPPADASAPAPEGAGPPSEIVTPDGGSPTTTTAPRP